MFRQYDTLLQLYFSAIYNRVIILIKMVICYLPHLYVKINGHLYVKINVYTCIIYFRDVYEKLLDDGTIIPQTEQAPPTVPMDFAWARVRRDIPPYISIMVLLS